MLLHEWRYKKQLDLLFHDGKLQVIQFVACRLQYIDLNNADACILAHFWRRVET